MQMADDVKHGREFGSIEQHALDHVWIHSARWLGLVLDVVWISAQHDNIGISDLTFAAGASEREGRRKAAPDGSPAPSSCGSGNREDAQP